MILKAERYTWTKLLVDIKIRSIQTTLLATAQCLYNVLRVNGTNTVHILSVFYATQGEEDCI